MKNKKRIFLLIGCLCLVFMVGCSSSTDTKKEEIKTEQNVNEKVKDNYLNSDGFNASLKTKKTTDSIPQDSI